MRVSVYIMPDGAMTALVQASPGSGLPPVLVSGVTEENVREKILPIVEAVRGPKTPTQLRLP